MTPSEVLKRLGRMKVAKLAEDLRQIARNQSWPSDHADCLEAAEMLIELKDMAREMAQRQRRAS